MTNFWQDNLAALKQHHPDLFNLISGHDYKPIGELIETPAGIPSLRFSKQGGVGPLAYNLEDPWLDTDIHLQSVGPESSGLALFIGMGLGYGPLRVLKDRPCLGMIVILEPNLDLIITAMHHVDLRPLLGSDKVRWFIGNIDLRLFEHVVSRIAALEDTHILRHVPSYQWREEEYMSLNKQAFLVVNQLNASGGTTRRAGKEFFRNRLANLTLLRHCHDLGIVKNIFAGKPAVLVAAGPSLDKSMADLKKVAGRCVLFAVDSALAPLLKAGITPDFVTTIDFMTLNFEKVAPFVGEKWPFSLIATIKVTPLIPKRLKTAHLFYAFNEDLPQLWIHDILGIKDLAPFAFSVAHLSLAVALRMGCDPIVFVGQDLSYTSKQADHAIGTIIMKNGLPTDRDFFQVRGVDGQMVSTDRGLLSLQKRFEDIIKANTEITYYNATAAGVHIQGTTPASLSQVFAQQPDFDVLVSAVVEQKVAEHSRFPVEAFIKKIESFGSDIKNIQGQLSDVLDLTKEVKREISGLRKKRAFIPAFENLPAKLTKRLIRFDRINRSLDKYHALSPQVLELTFAALKENDHRLKQNEELKAKEGYLAWLSAEIERIDSVNRERQKAFNLYGELLGNLGQHLAREQAILDQVAAAPSAQGYLDLACLHADSGDYNLARDVVDRLLALAPDSVAALLLAGEVWAALLQVDKANVFWQEAEHLAPESAEAVSASRVRQAEFWIAIADEHGNAEEGVDDFSQLLPTWLSRVAMILAHEQEVPELLQKLWQKHAAKIEEWLIMGDIDKVESTLRGWQAFGTRFPEVLVFQARCAAAKGDADAAIEIMGAAIQQKPEQSQWLALLARLFFESGRFAEGITRLQEAVALDPNTALLWEELGDALVKEGDAAGAIIAFQRCFVALPLRVGVLQKIGDCYLYNNQPEAAIAAYEAVLARAPDNEPASKQLRVAKALMAG